MIDEINELPEDGMESLPEMSHYIENTWISRKNLNKLYFSYTQKINIIDIVLVYDEMVPIHFWRVAIVTGVLPSRDSEIRGAIVRMTKNSTILKGTVNKRFTNKNSYYNINQTDKAREQKVRREAAVVGKLKTKY